jgi:hypothetical protein
LLIDDFWLSTEESRRALQSSILCQWSTILNQQSSISNQQLEMKVCGGAYVSSMYGQRGVDGGKRFDGRDCGARREHGAWNEACAERQFKEGDGKEKRRWQQ